METAYGPHRDSRGHETGAGRVLDGGSSRAQAPPPTSSTAGSKERAFQGPLAFVQTLCSLLGTLMPRHHCTSVSSSVKRGDDLGQGQQGWRGLSCSLMNLGTSIVWGLPTVMQSGRGMGQGAEDTLPSSLPVPLGQMDGAQIPGSDLLVPSSPRSQAPRKTHPPMGVSNCLKCTTSVSPLWGLCCYEIFLSHRIYGENTDSGRSCVLKRTWGKASL